MKEKDVMMHTLLCTDYSPSLVVPFLGVAAFFTVAASLIGRPRFGFGASSASSSALRFFVVLAVLVAALAAVVVAFLGGIFVGYDVLQR